MAKGIVKKRIEHLKPFKHKKNTKYLIKGTTDDLREAVGLKRKHKK